MVSTRFLELRETGKEEALCLLALKEKQWFELAIGRFGGAAWHLAVNEHLPTVSSTE